MLSRVDPTTCFSQSIGSYPCIWGVPRSLTYGLIHLQRLQLPRLRWLWGINPPNDPCIQDWASTEHSSLWNLSCPRGLLLDIDGYRYRISMPDKGQCKSHRFQSVHEARLRECDIRRDSQRRTRPSVQSPSQSPSQALP
jgi:hypothetical protein